MRGLPNFVALGLCVRIRKAGVRPARRVGSQPTRSSARGACRRIRAANHERRSSNAKRCPGGRIDAGVSAPPVNDR